MELVTAAQMRAIETEAIESDRVTGIDLMERAGQGVVDGIFEEWPEIEKGGRRALVLCGPGNNGGDGFVVARLLHERGWDVQVLLYGDASKLPPDAKLNHDRWVELGPVRPLVDAEFDGDIDVDPGAIIYVDALFGTGLTRPVSGLEKVERELNRAHARSDRHVVCIDIPSGLCSDSGRYLGRGSETPPGGVIRGDLTVTFHRAKCGHYLADGPDACGKLVVKDIGL